MTTLDNTTPNPRPVMLLVEDDKHLSDEICRIATDGGWNVLAERSVEQALFMAQNECGRISLAIVDVMIPLNQEDCDALDTEMNKRRQLAKTLINRRDPIEPDADQVRTIREQLDVIDFRIQKLVAIDGGLGFLRQAEAKGLLKNWHIGLCTARSNLENSIESLDLVKNRPGKWLGVFTKPLTPEKLLEILQHVSIGGRDE